MSPQEMKVRAAEEVAHEFPSPKQSQELVRRLAEYGVKLGAAGVRGTTLEDRLKYKAMYLRLKEFDAETGMNYCATVFFLEIDEDVQW